MSQHDSRSAAARVLVSDESAHHDSGAYVVVDGGRAPRGDGKPAHYKVICISMYTDDLKRLDGMVESLKARGLTKANRSALIRFALSSVDLERVPKGL